MKLRPPFPIGKNKETPFLTVLVFPYFRYKETNIHFPETPFFSETLPYRVSIPYTSFNLLSSSHLSSTTQPPSIFDHLHPFQIRGGLECLAMEEFK